MDTSNSEKGSMQIIDPVQFVLGNEQPKVPSTTFTPEQWFDLIGQAFSSLQGRARYLLGFKTLALHVLELHRECVQYRMEPEPLFEAQLILEGVSRSTRICPILDPYAPGYLAVDARASDTPREDYCRMHIGEKGELVSGEYWFKPVENGSDVSLPTLAVFKRLDKDRAVRVLGRHNSLGLFLLNGLVDAVGKSLKEREQRLETHREEHYRLAQMLERFAHCTTCPDCGCREKSVGRRCPKCGSIG